MSTSSDFPLSVVAHVCAGPAGLRERIGAHGFDTTTIARLVSCSPLTIARATKGGATPRGVLVSLAILATVLDQLDDRGIDVARLADYEALADDEICGIASQSPLAARMLCRLREVLQCPAQPAQLSFDTRAAA